MMTPYLSFKEVEKKQGKDAHGYRLLTEENGCTHGCCSGISIYSSVEFSKNPGAHEDQEGFYVLEGEGSVKLNELEFFIHKGDSFVAAPGVRHTIRTLHEDRPVKVFWFHSAI